MSEYQYYEFQAIDRPLDAGAQQALRNLSTRARITATSFTNSYEWGDFKGDPDTLMDNWFDLYLYVANWGSHRLIIRVPKRFVDQKTIAALLVDVETATARVTGDNLILDISADEVDMGGDFDDGSGWLAALAPLRADLMRGDLRCLYLLWLTAVADGVFEADEPEPLPGIGPLTGALKSLTDFIGLDQYLVAAAAERTAESLAAATTKAAIKDTVAALSDADKTAFLLRVIEGDPHVAIDLQLSVQKRSMANAKAPPTAARTVAELKRRARELGRESSQAFADAKEKSRLDGIEAEQQAQRSRMIALAARGERVWTDIETEIDRRSAQGYDRAARMLTDLKALATTRGGAADFTRRLMRLREAHARKREFVKRLSGL